MTKAKLEETLNKQSIELSYYRDTLKEVREAEARLKHEINWLRQTVQELLVALTAGAKEGNWPRKAQS